ncbi:hypothetical protein GALMADRAFT_76151 [Galerina marginata CBS 339.88]|uniref:Fungal-type protein kinase domain-containing protein n=1 Tax=Galerina marginata (strain CBS 339.88) TaxID=685588 RepID=A0A067SUM0_GALM3|nr:hypothetical protein GALMADRAFT_76151 [Galerina marginata CBS 339.88]
MKKDLKTDLSGHMYQNVSVEEFVTHIWGLDSTVVKVIVDSKISAPPDSLQQYRKVLNKKNSHETKLYKPFREISDQLLLDVCALPQLDGSGTTTCFWDGKGSQVLKGEFTSRKADLLRAWLPLPAKMTWELCKAPLEFKRHFEEIFNTPLTSSLHSIAEVNELPDIRSTELPSTANLDASRHTAKVSPDSATAGAKEPKATRSKRARGSKSPQSANEDTASGSHQATPVQTDSQSSKKRSFEEVDVSNAPSSSKRRRKDGMMVNDELQLATYALECLGCLGRNYATGIFIDRFTVSVWYFDRVAVIRSVGFNLDTPEGARYLALCLFALDQCSMQQAGFDPHLHRFIPPTSSNSPVTEACIETLDRATTMENGQLCFRFPKKPTDDRPDFVFQITEVLFSYRAIVGRGTLVAATCVYILNECLYRDHYAIKLSWQYPVRKSEGDILTKLRDTLPYWKRHLPDPLFSAEYTADELGIPRSKMELQEPANAAKIQGHYHAYHTGRVLHRDISENNLMIWRPLEETKTSKKSKAPESHGVLNDFDMAAEVGEDGELLVSAAHHRTGTLPFMARDLLEPVPAEDLGIRHLYRHDLESFFYILVWAAIHYDIPTKTRLPTPKTLQKWLDPIDAFHRKSTFINEDSPYIEIRAHCRPEYGALWKKWVDPLRGVLYLAGVERRTNEMGGKSFDNDTCNGKLTFHSFMAAMSETPRGLNAVVVTDKN